MPTVVVVCTANLSRSPMAAALLAAAVGPAAVVTSAGVEATAGGAAGPDALAAMAARGLDLSGHRSRPLDAAIVGGADLVVAMTREHVRRVAVAHPGSFGRTWTLKELVRRGGAHGPRTAGVALPDWLAGVAAGAGRRVADLLGDDPADDVADPYRRGAAAYERTAAELADLTGALARLAFGA